MTFQKGTVVTLDVLLGSSNTFIVDADEGDTVLITHPLAYGTLKRVSKEEINTVGATIKDSTERCIDFANHNQKFLDYNTIGDLKAIGQFFAFRRFLTPRQKQILANICGVIASVKFNNDLHQAMRYVTQNQSILDEFNAMWFNNFKGLFSGQQPITSKKQRSAIFNIAGYVLAELENPTVQDRK